MKHWALKGLVLFTTFLLHKSFENQVSLIIFNVICLFLSAKPTLLLCSIHLSSESNKTILIFVLSFFKTKGILSLFHAKTFKYFGFIDANSLYRAMHTRHCLRCSHKCFPNCQDLDSSKQLRQIKFKFYRITV